MAKITWKRPAPLVEAKGPFDLALDFDDVRADFNRRFADLAIPSVEGVSPKQELIILLKVAAEIEHALLLQYLYAAYTIVDKGHPLRKALIRISVQEMGHLLAVQNLLLCIGGIGEVHLFKSEFRLEGPDKLLPYSLEPVSKTLLARYVAAEAPLEIPESLKQRVIEIHEIAKNSVGVEFTPVGGIYAQIFWLFQVDDNPVSDLMPLFPNDRLIAGRHVTDWDFSSADEIKKFEADYEVWNIGGGDSLETNQLRLSDSLYRVNERREILKLVHGISAQGEGADFSPVDSHFERFLDAFDEFGEHEPELVEAPVNPIIGENDEYEVFTKIENSYTLLWASLMNTLYSSLLLDIYSSMFYFGLSFEDKDRYLRMVFTNMKSLIGPLITVLFKLPLKDDGFAYDTPPLAGPTFEIDAEFGHPGSKEALDDLNNRFLDLIAVRIDAIKAHTDFSTHQQADGGDSGIILLEIEDYISQKRTLVNS